MQHDGPLVLVLSDLHQEWFNTTYGNLTQRTPVIHNTPWRLVGGNFGSKGDETPRCGVGERTDGISAPKIGDCIDGLMVKATLKVKATLRATISPRFGWIRRFKWIREFRPTLWNIWKSRLRY